MVSFTSTEENKAEFHSHLSAFSLAAWVYIAQRRLIFKAGRNKKIVPQIKKKRYQQCDSGVWILSTLFLCKRGRREVIRIYLTGMEVHYN